MILNLNVSTLVEPKLNIYSFHQCLILISLKLDFRLAMLSKYPYHSFTQFLLVLKGHEQVLLNAQEK